MSRRFDPRLTAAFVAVLIGAFMAAAGLAVWTIGKDQAEARQAVPQGKAKNVILLIGDGTAESEITIARNYHLGAAGRFALDTLPEVADYTTYSVQETAPETPEYYPESASTATAFSTGSKTSNGRISTTPSTDEDLRTILEIAQSQGYKTGDVTTARLTDATPAAPASHVSSRRCEGPEDTNREDRCPQDAKANGGPGSIAEQQVDHGVDVLLGGGRERFEQIVDGGPDAGNTVIESAERQGYELAFDRASLEAVQPGQKVLGLFNAPEGDPAFNDQNLTLEWAGPMASTFPGPTQRRCDEDNLETLRPNEPSLPEMTAKAIDLLEQPGGKGFFLQVEGASIDKQDHAANVCTQIGETVAFDESVRVALDYQRENPQTLVIVTGDHAHTSQIVQVNQSDPTGATDVPTPADAATHRVTTEDGVDMRVVYGTAPIGVSQQHTGGQIRVAAGGPGAERVEGTFDQTGLFGIMRDALARPAAPGPNNPRGCTVTGTNRDDVLFGTDDNDVICGLGGNDKIYGGLGDDTIFGDAGNDPSLNGEQGRDRIFGGGGPDDANKADDGVDRLNGGRDADALNTRDGAGGDTLDGSGDGVKDTFVNDPGDRIVG